MDIPLQRWTMLAALVCCLGLSMAAPDEDLVTDLPGLAFTPTFKHYSGYLDALPKAKFHYYFVEAASNPSSAPLVLWMMDGNGCSSMISLMSEHGPFQLQEDGRTIKKNDYSWNTVANIIYLDAPSWAGFSKQNYEGFFTEVNVVNNMVAAMESFYKKFPEYKTNDFYISTSYMSSTYALLLGNDIPISRVLKNVKGYIFVQAQLPMGIQTNAWVYDSYYNGLIGKEQFEKLLMACCKTLETSYCDFFSHYSSRECFQAVFPISNLVTSFNYYNMYHPKLGGVEEGSDVDAASHSNFVGAVENEQLGIVKQNRSYGYFCYAKDISYITKYFNQSSVVKAVHVDTDKPWATGLISKGILQTVIDDKLLLEGYRNSFNQKKKTMMIYGDMATIFTAIGGEVLVNQLNQTESAPKRMWFYEDARGQKQVGGRIEFYGNATFVILNGSGQKIGQDAPVQALKLFREFFNGFNSMHFF